MAMLSAPSLNSISKIPMQLYTPMVFSSSLGRSSSSSKQTQRGKINLHFIKVVCGAWKPAKAGGRLGWKGLIKSLTNKGSYKITKQKYITQVKDVLWMDISIFFQNRTLLLHLCSLFLRLISCFGEKRSRPPTRPLQALQISQSWNLPPKDHPKVITSGASCFLNKMLYTVL